MVGWSTTSVRRAAILVTLSLAQLMVVLDTTVMTITVPRAQATIGFATSDRVWVIGVYNLAFGSFLLMGGRLGDRFGHRRMLVAGLVGFGTASAFAAAAGTLPDLLVARAVQGACGALVAPAILAMLASTFASKVSRARTFSWVGSLTGTGAALGLLVGGILTHVASWRWTLGVDVPICALVLLGVIVLVRADVPFRGPGPAALDSQSSTLAAGAMLLLMVGLAASVSASRTHWNDLRAGGAILGAVGVAVVLVVWQRRRARQPLTARLVRHRGHVGALVALFLSLFVIVPVSLFLAYYMENELGLSALETGAAFLPFVVAVGISASVASARLLPAHGARALVPAGMLLGALGVILFTRLPVSDQYAAHIVPGLLVLGLGVGLIVGPATATAIEAMPPSETGVAAATVGVAQVAGAAAGTSLLGTVVVTVAQSAGRYIAPLGPRRASLAFNPQSAATTIHAYSVSFWWAAAVFGAGTVLTGSLLESGTPE